MNSYLTNMFAVAAILISPSAYAGAESHGGSADELEFIGLGHQVAGLLSDWGPSQAFPEIDIAAFKLAISETRVRFTDEILMSEGREVDALNDASTKAIQVNRPRYILISGRADQKLALVFHEYLGILGIEADHYRLSTRFLDRLAREALEDSARRYFCAASCGFWRNDYLDGGHLISEPATGIGATRQEAWSRMVTNCESRTVIRGIEIGQPPITFESISAGGSLIRVTPNVCYLNR